MSTRVGSRRVRPAVAPPPRRDRRRRRSVRRGPRGPCPCVRSCAGTRLGGADAVSRPGGPPDGSSAGIVRPDRGSRRPRPHGSGRPVHREGRSRTCSLASACCSHADPGESRTKAGDARNSVTPASANVGLPKKWSQWSWVFATMRGNRSDRGLSANPHSLVGARTVSISRARSEPVMSTEVSRTGSVTRMCTVADMPAILTDRS